MTRQQLIQQARTELNLTNLAPVDWSYSQRIAYNKRLAELIASNEGTIPPQEVAVAKDILAKSYDPLEDTSSFDSLQLFGSAFADELLATGDAVADIGRGVRDTVSMVGNALPYVAALAFVGISLYFVFKYDPRRNGIEK